ncbi:MAG: hypothetical protein IJN64_08060 [Lachnospiraceae bacterium]|nr:hypothetical protein [Lachnospiraceae bacterium]
MSELDNENDYTLVFDHFYTTNHIQILKSLLPFFHTGLFSYLPVLIKYLELQHTLELTKKRMQPLNHGIYAASNQSHDLDEIYKTIKKYLTPEEEKNIHQILDMMHTMENVKEMQKMMEFFQNMTGDDSSSANPFPDLSMFENIMGNNMNMADIMQFFNNINT